MKSMEIFSTVMIAELKALTECKEKILTGVKK